MIPVSPNIPHSLGYVFLLGSEKNAENPLITDEKCDIMYSEEFWAGKILSHLKERWIHP